MSLLRTGDQPECSRGVAVRPLVAALCALSLAGCRGHTEAYNTDPQMNVVVQRPAAVAEAELEADGLPSQLPPSTRARQTPDDPSEPWSRNYGGHAASDQEDLAAEAPADVFRTSQVRMPAPIISANVTIPADLPPAFRRQLAAANTNE